MSSCVEIIFSHSQLLTYNKAHAFSGNGDKILRRRSAAAYEAGQLKTVAHAILSPYVSVPVLVHVRVWVHIPCDPQSVQLRNATTTTI